MTEQTMTTVDLTKYIETRFFGERPHVRGRRVPVALLAYCARDQKWSVPRLAYEFTLSETEVLAALLYYRQQYERIDAQEQAYQAELDEAYEKYGSR